MKRLFFILPALLALMLALCMTACEEPAPEVTISLNATSRTLQVGPGAQTSQKTATLRATVKENDETVADAVVVWTTSDATKAMVVDGLVTAVAAGEATITAAYGEQTATCLITVQNVEVITISETAITIDLDVLNTFTLTATSSAGGAITWKSSDTTKATVLDGVVTGINVGTSTITASQDGATAASCVVTIVQPSAPYTFTTANYATCISDPGNWHWFTQGANTGLYTFASGWEPTYRPVGGTLSMGFSNITPYDPATSIGIKEYAFRMQPLLKADVNQNVGTEYEFSATISLSKAGELAIYDRNLGADLPADNTGLAEAAGVNTDVLKKFNLNQGDNSVTFTGTVNTNGCLTIRPFLFGGSVEEPITIIVSNMLFKVGGVSIDFRTGLPL